MTPKCPKCGNTTFEAASSDALDLNVNFISICCKSCSNILGIFDVDTHDLIKKIAKAMHL